MLILIFAVLNEEQRELVEKLFREHHEQFRRVSFRILHSETDAEDVVSAAFIKIIDNIEKISELSCPEMTAFCVTIVKNASVDAIRRSQKLISTEDIEAEGTAADDDVEDACIRHADAQRMCELIDTLPSEDKRLVQMRYAMEMGYAEIGELLGISEDTARKRGQRLASKLKTMYGEE